MSHLPLKKDVLVSIDKYVKEQVYLNKIRELSNRIDSLENKNNELDRRVTRLENRGGGYLQRQEEFKKFEKRYGI